MICLPDTPHFRAIAERVIWFKPPADALAQPYELMSYAMQYGTADDMAVLIDTIGSQGLVDAIKHAHPGIISPRSWSYWTLKAGRYGTPLPKRNLS